MSFQAWKKKFLNFLTFLVSMVLPGRGLCLLAETVNCSIELSMIETTIVYPLKRLTAFRDEGYFSVLSLTESEPVHI